jgi:hypothetical protein
MERISSSMESKKQISKKKLSRKKNIILGPSNDPEKYLLIKIIGRGKYGVTYMAQNVNRKNGEDEFYAVKLLSQPDNGTQEDLEDLENDWLKETNCLKSVMKVCKNDGILCYFDSFISEKDGKKEFVIVTHYLGDYISLHKYLANENNILFENDAKDIYKKIVNVKNKLTDLCINHSDLHLDNIMINPETKDIKIIDLGRCQTPQEEILEWFDSAEEWRDYSDDSRMKELREALYEKVYGEEEFDEDDFMDKLKEQYPIQMYKLGCTMNGEVKEVTLKSFLNEIKCLMKLSELNPSSYTKKTIMMALYDYLVRNKDMVDNIPKMKTGFMNKLEEFKNQDKDFEPYYQKLK